jgi:hypothetical protein
MTDTSTPFGSWREFHPLGSDVQSFGRLDEATQALQRELERSHPPTSSSPSA